MMGMGGGMGMPSPRLQGYDFGTWAHELLRGVEVWSFVLEASHLRGSAVLELCAKPGRQQSYPCEYSDRCAEVTLISNRVPCQIHAGKK